MALEEKPTTILILAFFSPSQIDENKPLTRWEHLMVYERNWNSSNALSSSGFCDLDNSCMGVSSSSTSSSLLLLSLLFSRIPSFYP